MKTAFSPSCSNLAARWRRNLLLNSTTHVRQDFRNAVKTICLALLALTFSAVASAVPPDITGNEHYVDTHLHKALQGFLTALEEKQPERFFEEAWALSEQANQIRFGKGAEIPAGEAFGVPELTQQQRDTAPKVWAMLKEHVDLDASFNAKDTALSFTVKIWRGAIRMSPRFILETEEKILNGVEKKRVYGYLAFRHDMVKEFGFWNDETLQTPTRQLARAGTRTDVTKALTKSLGSEKGQKFKQVLDKYLLEVIGAAVFAHAEASALLASAKIAEGS